MVSWRSSPALPFLPPFSARLAWSNSSAGLQQQDGEALQFVSTELQDDLKIRTLASVQQGGQHEDPNADALKEAPEELRKDRGFMLMVMKANGMALQWVTASYAWLRLLGVSASQECK